MSVTALYYLFTLLKVYQYQVSQIINFIKDHYEKCPPPTQQSEFFEIFGKNSPIMEAFSKGKKKKHQTKEIYALIQSKKSQKKGL